MWIFGLVRIFWWQLQVEGAYISVAVLVGVGIGDKDIWAS